VLAEETGEPDGFIDGPAPCAQSVAEMRTKRASGRPLGADGVNDFKGQAGAVLKTAAVGIGALVGEGERNWWRR